MAVPRRIADIKPLFTNLAQTSHYQVMFGGLPSELKDYLRRRGVTSRFINEDAGLLCYSTSLPTTSYSPKIVDGNFTGINEKFAVNRLYTEIGLDFYVDNNYKVLKFLEHWMEFISSGSHNPIRDAEKTAGPVDQANSNYFIRMQYPEYYKSNFTKILKFDRDYRHEIQYTFFGLWPTAISAPPVSYQESDVLKVSATFQYDRYVAGTALSYNRAVGNDNNKEQPNKTSGHTYYQTGQSLVEPGVREVTYTKGNVNPTIIQ